MLRAPARSPRSPLPRRYSRLCNRKRMRPWHAFQHGFASRTTVRMAYAARSATEGAHAARRLNASRYPFAGAKLLIELRMAGDRCMLNEMGVPLGGSRGLVPEDGSDLQQVRAVLGEQRCARMAQIVPPEATQAGELYAVRSGLLRSGNRLDNQRRKPLRRKSVTHVPGINRYRCAR